jgi:hypothetical protein
LRHQRSGGRGHRTNRKFRHRSQLDVEQIVRSSPASPRGSVDILAFRRRLRCSSLRCRNIRGRGFSPATTPVAITNDQDRPAPIRAAAAPSTS